MSRMSSDRAIINGVQRRDVVGKCTICGAVIKPGDLFTHEHRGHPASTVDATGYPKTPVALGDFDDPEKFRCSCGVAVHMTNAKSITHSAPVCDQFSGLSSEGYLLHVFGPRMTGPPAA